MTETKRCTKCHYTKPLSDYYRRDYSDDKLQNSCKECQKSRYHHRVTLNELSEFEKNIYIIPKIKNPSYVDEVAIEIVKHRWDIYDAFTAFRAIERTTIFNSVINKLKSWRRLK